MAFFIPNLTLLRFPISSQNLSLSIIYITLYIQRRVMVESDVGTDAIDLRRWLVEDGADSHWV